MRIAVPRGRHAWVAMLVAVLLAGSGVAAWLLTRGGDTPAAPADAATPAGLARQACALMVRMQRDVQRNAAAATVLTEVRDAERLSSRASDADPRYVTLASGIQAVRAALDADDATAAQVGMSVVITSCRQIER